jgi:hypothetical protein
LRFLLQRLKTYVISERFPTYPAINYGPLAVDKINSVLGTELELGDVRLSRTAHKHIAKDHPEDYVACLASIKLAVTSPSFIGQAPGHSRNFEIVRRINSPDGKEVLVAIRLEPDKWGDYSIVSSYRISKEMVEERRLAKRLIAPPP